jgi:hypothetical protein
MNGTCVAGVVAFDTCWTLTVCRGELAIHSRRMGGGRRWAVVCVAALAVLSAATAHGASHPLVTGLYMDSGDEAGADPNVVFKRAVGLGIGVARFTVYWGEVAPRTLPDSWQPADPADPHYDWIVIDEKVKRAVAAGLQPLITIMQAPKWAQDAPAAKPPNSRLPNADDFARFAKAIATRYSGNFQDLPRVRYWQAWNEPNISLYLVPQLKDGKPVSPAWYRQMLNAFYDAVHGVRADNVVVSAGLAPFHDITTEVTDQDPDWGPLSFMRGLLCLSETLQPTCDQKAKFDVWAQHPYTSGGPQHKAVLPNDVSLGDLPKVRKVLAAAQRAGHIVSRGQLGFWVTEFSWDSSPPDPQGVPSNLAARWVAEALYRAWSNGVTLVTWLALRDEPMDTSYYQSGLYYSGKTIAQDKPKPLLKAFRFPVYAAPRGPSHVFVWGRTPPGVKGKVILQRSHRGGWRTLAAVRPDRYGIFSGTYRGLPTGSIRARLSTKEVSRPFGLASVPDHWYNPFGGPRLEPPK